MSSVFSETILNCHFFRNNATVNIRNSISDFPDLKLWVQIPELKNMSSFFRHNNQQTFFLHSRHSHYTKFRFRFSGLIIMSSDSLTQKFEISFPDLNFEVATYKKFKQKIKKFQSSKIFRKRSQMSKGVLGRFFWKRFFCPVFHGVIEISQKNQEKFQNSKSAQIDPKSVQTCFEHALGRFFRFFLPSVPCRAFQVSWT